ncbi:MAG: SRPBCC family protein [Chloroflexi bacterium]|nr:SRPBCC family protein [Chloroflexota bacterium]
MAEQQTKMIIVKAPIEEVYRAWADFENFPKFMKEIKSVKKTGDRTSHWVMKGPLGRDLEWDAEITRLDENRRIAWNSTRGDLETSGQVVFTELPEGETEVTFTQHYEVPGGAVGEAVAKVIENPDEQLMSILREFKAYCEGRIRRAAA